MCKGSGKISVILTYKCSLRQETIDILLSANHTRYEFTANSINGPGKWVKKKTIIYAFFLHQKANATLIPCGSRLIRHNR